MGSFAEGVEKKPFGIYITPETSPVQPERFTGYHTGVDVEILQHQQDSEIPIYAIADGIVELNRLVNGYGGVVILSFELDGKSYSALYGHVKVSADLDIGEQVSAGQFLTHLGRGFSDETDGERRHLHFSLKPGIDLDLRGYVQNKSELEAWLNPQEFFTAHSAAEPD